MMKFYGFKKPLYEFQAGKKAIAQQISKGGHFSAGLLESA